MDDQQLGGLFRTADEATEGPKPAAVDHGAPSAPQDHRAPSAPQDHDAPPAPQDHGDQNHGDQNHGEVVDGSRRSAWRRIAVGAAIALALVAAIAALATGVLNRPDPSASGLVGPQPSYSAPYMPNVPSSGPSAPSEPSAPGGPVGGPAPAAPAPGLQTPGPQTRSDADTRSKSRSENAAAGGPGCAEPDVRVFAYLAVALPDARSTRPYAVPGGCPAGGVGVALDVVDDTSFGVARGTLLVVLTPPGADSGAPPDSATVLSGIAPARSGGMLRITAGSAGNGQVPFRQRVAQLATQLAAKL